MSELNTPDINGNITPPEQNPSLIKKLFFGLLVCVLLVLFVFLINWGFSRYWENDNKFVFWNVTTIVVAFVVSYVLGLVRNVDQIKLIRDSLFSSLLAGLFVSCVSMLYTVDKIDGYFKNDADLYSRVVKKIGESSSKSDVRRVLLNQKLERLKSELSSLDADYLSIPADEILNVWGTMVGNSKKQFYAINIVPDWSKVSRDSTGIRGQKEALERGVNIKRIYVFGNDCPENMPNCEEKEYSDAMRKLFDKQSELRNETTKGQFTQYEIKRNELRENPSYAEFRNKLGTDDIVIVDDELVLLTVVDAKSKMLSAKVSFQPDIVNAAKQLFELLERDLTSTPSNKPSSVRIIKNPISNKKPTG
jgi:hypothetical protein